jgi:hypothetical protein
MGVMLNATLFGMALSGWMWSKVIHLTGACHAAFTLSIALVPIGRARHRPCGAS